MIHKSVDIVTDLQVVQILLDGNSSPYAGGKAPPVQDIFCFVLAISMYTCNLRI